jgi:hypothetical protein
LRRLRQGQKLNLAEEVAAKGTASTEGPVIYDHRLPIAALGRGRVFVWGRCSMRRHFARTGLALLCVGLPLAGAVVVGAGPAGAAEAASSTNSSLTGVACASATSCTAVGFATVGGVEVPLAEGWNGKAWTAETLPKASLFAHGALVALSCPSTASCTAVGWYDNTKGAQVMLAYGWNGKAWTVQATPAPADYYGQSVNGVDCVSTTSCYAVGTYFQGSGAQVTIDEYWNGKTWAKQATPAGTPWYLVAASCSSGTSCTSVGSMVKGSGPEETLAEHWNGKSWATETVPDPKGSAGTYALGLSCPSASMCESVGYYQTNTAYLGFAQSWNGKSWTIQSTPKPASGASDFLAGVSCTSSTACVAAGYGQNSAGTSSVLAESWNGKAWATVPAATPTGAAGASLFWVSCSAATACTAVGTYQKGSVSDALAERWNGKSWALETTQNA